MNLGQIPVMPSDLRGWRVFCRSRQTDSRSPTPLESGREADAALLFWEVDSSVKGVNGGGGGRNVCNDKPKLGCLLSPLVSRNQGPVAFSRDVIVGPGVAKTVLAPARIPTAL